MKKARVRSKSLPWISREIQVLMQARTYHLTKANKNRKLEYWAKFKSIRNQLKMYMRKAKLEYFKQLSGQSVSNPRKVWQEVNRLLGRGGKQEIDSLRTDGGQAYI